MTNAKSAMPPMEHDRWGTFNYMVDRGIIRFKMNASQCAIYFAMFRHADKKGHCHLSYSRIAEGSGLSARRCVSNMKPLLEKKVVEVVRKGTRGGVNHYRIFGIIKTQKQPS